MANVERGDPLEDLGGVGHAVLRKFDRGRRPTRECAETVVRVREVESCRPSREDDRRTQEASSHRRDQVRVAEKPRAEHHIRPIREDGGDQRPNVGGVVLTVGVEGDDDVGAASERTSDTRHESRPLPAIDRVGDHERPGGPCGGPGAVSGAVVDDDALRDSRQDGRDHVPDHARLPERRDHGDDAGRKAHDEGRLPRKPGKVPSVRDLTCPAATVIHEGVESTLTKFAPAKLNLFLEIRGKRSDGYHEIDTVMETIAVGDLVGVSEAAELTVESNRHDVPSNEGNTCFKIVRVAERVLGRPLPARVFLTKMVPPGTGLGAGSSDAVATLDLVLALHGVDASDDVRRAIAAEVGSDVAFFVTGGTARCTGRGEIVAPCETRSARYYVLALSDQPCPTAEVYAALRLDGSPPREPHALLEALAAGKPIPESPNRLEAAALSAFPWLAETRSRLTDVAGRAPTLSGSGSTWWFACANAQEAADLEARLIAGQPQCRTFRTATYRGGRRR